MAQSLISIITLATLVVASPLGKRQDGCSETYWSKAGDTCNSIGAMFGLTGDAIKQYNDYVDCNDIWVNTPICIGPLPSVTTSAPSCVETWWSQPGETCDSIGARFGLTGTAIYNANTYLDCSDIWTNTPVCIPHHPSPTSTTSSASCVETWWSQAGDTCKSIGALFGLTEQTIINANGFLDCSDIWVNTPVCIPYLPSVTTIFPSYSTTSVAGPVYASTAVCLATYNSVAGDTCDSIGARFGRTGAQILGANPFLTCDDIWAWTPVCIPAIV